MYLARRGRRPPDEDRVGLRGSGGSWRRLIVAPNVVLLGLTSLVTDVSSEMVASVLPLYLTARLGFSALQFGAADGLLQVATALTALVGALAADRWRRYREVAGAGYAASAASRLGLLTARGWLPTLGWLSADRVGKGVRTGPRDALISLSAPAGRVGEAFGLHRALDTGGALFGPLVAVVLLSVAPGSYQAVFVASFLIAVVGVALLWLFVENRVPLTAMLGEARARLWAPFGALWAHREFRRVVAAAVVLAIPAVSDSFLFLTLRRGVGLDQRLFPILFVAESVIYLMFAVPFGRLADRIGPSRVLLVGQVALAASYGLLIASPGRTVMLVAVPACLGVFFAATDGVLAALTCQVAPDMARTTGLAVIAVVVAAGRAVAATGYGAIWQRSGPHQAVVDALAALVIAGVVAAALLRPFVWPGRAHIAPTEATVPATSPTTGGASPHATTTATVASAPRRGLRQRITAFVLLAVACAAGVIGITAHARQRTNAASRASPAHRATITPKRVHTPTTAQPTTATPTTAQPTAASSATLAGLVARPHLLVVDSAQGASFGRVEVADIANPTGPRASTSLICDRVDQAAGRGICLTIDPAPIISIFDDHFNVVFTLPLDGLPSRARVAPNGQIAAATSFLAGDAYNVDNFSTRTELIDVIHGTVIADLERFALTKTGRRFYAIDENFWGVTFAADSDTFYATMRTGNDDYLIRGHVHTRRAEILRDRVECPSISPDGTRLVYKSRIDHGFDPATWRLHVLDLATGTDHPLAETRSVDDQAAWIDNTHVVYGVNDNQPDGSTIINTWTVPADGTGTPTLEIPAVNSPAPITGR